MHAASYCEPPSCRAVSLYVSVTIHIPIPNRHTTHETSGSADTPVAIATEAPEGTYILPVTENSKQKSPPTVNLVLNLRLIMDIGTSTAPLSFKRNRS